MITSLFGLTNKQIIDFVLTSGFIGTDTWPAVHPIWHSYIPGKLSPYKAWKDVKSVTRAVNNMFSVLQKSISENKYANFVTSHERAFNNCVLNNSQIISGNDLLQKVLNRFTIAKIAPKVTALRAKTFERILNDNNIDLSSGVYCPMAGFGGIITGSINWLNSHNIALTNKIEAYDINQSFCDWYGWAKRDVLAQTIKTDKICIACPPFGEKYEHWVDVSENVSEESQKYYQDVSSFSFEKWVELIKKHVIAPNYIFFGPELVSKTNVIGLFKRKVGIKYYPEYSNS